MKKFLKAFNPKFWKLKWFQLVKNELKSGFKCILLLYKCNYLSCGEVRARVSSSSCISTAQALSGHVSLKRFKILSESNSRNKDFEQEKIHDIRDGEDKDGSSS